jgi:hypothetical protein
MQFSTFVMSCAEREDTLSATLGRLEASGWPWPVELVLDDGLGERRIDRIHRTWRRLIRRASEQSSELVLLLEDDVVFGRWFVENLTSWELLRQVPPGRAFYASLYNPSRPFILRRAEQRYMVAEPRSVWGSQALVTTPETARFIDAHWDTVDGNPDQRMPVIAGRVTPIYYHVPSLVDHAPVPTTWGGMEHSAIDFDPEWRSGAPAPTSGAHAPGPA